MTCVRKEYEIKTNGTGAMTTAKKDFFKGYNMKIVIQAGGGEVNICIKWGNRNICIKCQCS